MNRKIFIANENKWIATDTAYKKLFASGVSLRQLQKKLKEREIQNAVTLFVPPFDKTLAPQCRY